MERFLTERFLKTFLLVIGLIFSSAAGYEIGRAHV